MSPTRLLAWNLGRRNDTWRALLDAGADVALVSEATAPPKDVASRLSLDPAPWRTAGRDRARPFRTAVVPLSPTVQVDWFTTAGIAEAGPDDLAVSRPGTLAAATITAEGTEPFIAVALYGAWERPHRSTRSSWIVADASVHRLISDMSALVGRQGGHRILAAGDLNILHGHGEEGSTYWARRYATVFERMDAIGLSFVGPQFPHGRQAHPWPAELPKDSRNVPTYRSNRMSPDSAVRQLDFVFASSAFADSVQTRARNAADEWSVSDHCPVQIDVR